MISRARQQSTKLTFGQVEFAGGAYPTPETIEKVYAELDRQRATQLYLDLFPTLSVHGILKGQVRDLGVRSSSDILVTPQKMNSTPLWLTGNTDSIYAWMTLDLKADGPTVIEIPPNVMGPLDDANFRFVVDFGATGPDKGEGGKYLILPPRLRGRRTGRLFRRALPNLPELGTATRQYGYRR